MGKLETFRDMGEPTGDGRCARRGEDALVRSLFRAQRLAATIADRLAAPIGLTSSRWMLLCAISRFDKAPTVGALSRRVMMSVQNVSRMLSAMEEDGLVRRWTSPGFGRAVFIELTDQGSTTLGRTGEIAERFDELALAGIDQETRARLECDLQRLVESLECCVFSEDEQTGASETC